MRYKIYHKDDIPAGHSINSHTTSIVYGLDGNKFRAHCVVDVVSGTVGYAFGDYIIIKGEEMMWYEFNPMIYELVSDGIIEVWLETDKI